MNDGKYLSLGNLFNLIKEVSIGKSAMQSEIFCVLFNIKDINNTTVNNYLIGIRAIGIEYKKIYIDLYKNYENDKDVFFEIIVSLISLLDEKIYNINDVNYNYINSNHNLIELCIKLFNISKNDVNVPLEFNNMIDYYIKNNMYYESIIEFICYAVIKNVQPIYEQDINIKINRKELNEYLKVKLYEGVSYIKSLILLSKKNNMYACADLGALEFDGEVSGVVNYDKSYEYYMMAALKNHPKACYMVANLIYKRKVNYDFDTMWKYLNKSIKLGSNAGLNLKGLCYLNGVNPSNKVDIRKAIKYFELSSKSGYTYAFNNLGYIYEKDNNTSEAFKYYKISADLGDSWALNRVGEYYRKQGDLDKAYIYYKLSDECPVNERCKWAKYNLDKYYKNK